MTRAIRATGGLLGLALLLSAPAGAATLPFTATLNVTVGDLPGADFTAAGVATSDGLGGGFTLPSGIFSGVATFSPTLFTGVSFISGLTVTAMGNDAGSFAPSFTPPLLHTTVTFMFNKATYMTPGISLVGGGVGGPMGINGAALVTILGGLATLNIPLSNVGGGSKVRVVNGAVVIVAAASQWTTGTGVMRSVTTTSTHTPGSTSTPLFGTVTVMGYDHRTAGGQGAVRLVVPVKAVVGLGSAADPAFRLPVITSLTVNFVPEPGTGLLLAAGLLALAWHGSLRRGRA